MSREVHTCFVAESQIFHSGFLRESFKIGIRTANVFHVSSLFPMQGDRFGGALDAAAKQFSEAYDSSTIPMDFVNKMRSEHKLIMGIGHIVKSVSKILSHLLFQFLVTYIQYWIRI